MYQASGLSSTHPLPPPRLTNAHALLRDEFYTRRTERKTAAGSKIIIIVYFLQDNQCILPNERKMTVI